MRPTSIVSLIIAVLLIILGLVTCMIAQNMANANGELLFSETREDGLVNTVDLTDSELSKIELIVSDAEINIIGRSDKSCIEFVNFRENYYNLAAANRVLSFSEIPDITSMLKFWENGFTFKGMRYILNFAKDQKQPADTKRIINLYLTSDKEIKIFDIQADSCTLNIESMSSSTDYNINVKNADITTTGLKTSSSFNINSGESDSPARSVTLGMNTAMVARLNVNAHELNMDANVYRCSAETNITCSSGSVDIETVKKTESVKLSVDTISGTVHIDGIPESSPYSHTTQNADDPRFTVTTDSANVRISSVSAGSDQTEQVDESGDMSEVVTEGGGEG